MLKVLSSILCDLDPKVKALGQKAGICDGVPSTSALVLFHFGYKFMSKKCSLIHLALGCQNQQNMNLKRNSDQGLPCLLFLQAFCEFQP